jgi:SpoVK/Ycf46/Vps4 family AAA+-type ATPase
LNQLVIGPTGTGKTHLAQEVASVLDWPVFKITASSWIVWGAREEATWKTFYNWASKQVPDTPLVVILDEIDKVAAGATPSDSWSRHMIAEVLSFLDKTAPPQLEDEQEHPDDPEPLKDALERVIFIGCGAFQDSREKKSMGFVEIEQSPTALADISKHLPRELVNRFAKVLVLPELQKSDYEDIVKQLARRLPRADAQAYTELSQKMMQEALDSKSGARFAEVVLAELYELKAVEQVRKEQEENELWDIPVDLTA